jgi:hypothetical protein
VSIVPTARFLLSMDNQQTIDRNIVIPVLIGGVSIVGIIAVLLIGRALQSPAQIVVTPSATPFQFVFLGTEPAIVTPLLEESELPITEEPIEEEPIEGEPVEGTPPVLRTSTRPAVPTSAIATTPSLLISPTAGAQRTSTPMRLATSTLSSPVAANTYDDTDSRLTYSGNWVAQANVNGAYQNTLHVSDAAGNSVSFNFVGQEIQLYYQAGVGLGTVNITFDNETLAIPLSQAQTSGVWTYLLNTAGDHTVTIRHASGGSVNIDRLVIPALTPTPTRTPTPTP